LRQGFSASASLSLRLLVFGFAASARSPRVEVKRSNKHDVSRPLKEYPATPAEPGPTHEHLPWRAAPQLAPSALKSLIGRTEKS